MLLLVEKPDFRLGACQCSSNGTINCDVYGNCVCREGYTGTKCDQCQSGFSKNASGMCIGTFSAFIYSWASNYSNGF